MCMSDPFPVVDDTLTTNQFTGGVSTGNWLDVGGNMYFPSAIMSVGSSLELANNQTHVYGSGDGGAVTGGSPTIFQAASGFIPYYTSGQTPCNTSTPPFSNSCFSPAVVAFGAKAGDMAVLNLGPYRQTIEGIDVDAQGNAHIGFSMYSGQEGSSVKRLSVTDAKGTGIDWCGFYGQCGDGLLLDEFTVTHTSNTCVNPSTPVSFTSWSATVVAGVGLVVVGTYSGVSTPPNPPPLPGYYATFAGLPCSGGTCPSGVDPNGVYRIAATYSGTTTPVTLWADGRIAQAVSGGSYFTGLSPQIAWVINGSTAGSAGMGGQATFTSVEAAFNGFSSREIKNATLDSGTSCTATPYADMEVSSNGLANPALQNIQNIHMEHATNGAVIGEDGVTSMILGDDWNCNHISGDCVLISNQFGGPTNVTLRNIASANGNNTLVDEQNGNTITQAHNPIISEYRLDPTGTAWAMLQNCTDMSNGWCFSNGTWQLYSGSHTPVFSVSANGSTTVGSPLATSSPYNPVLLLNPNTVTGATWSSSGTFLGANAPSGFAGNFLDFRLNGGGSSLFSVNDAGATLIAANAAGSLPALSLSGSVAASTPYDPLLLLNPSAASGATWSSSGTFFGANAPTGFAGNFLDLRMNGAATPAYSINSTGLIAQYKGTNTQGMGVPAIYGSQSCTQTSCPTASYSNLVTAGSNDVMWLVNAAVSCTSVLVAGSATVSVQYTDPSSTSDVLNSSVAFCSPTGYSTGTLTTAIIVKDRHHRSIQNRNHRESELRGKSYRRAANGELARPPMQ
jgi:hypothetical protein